MKNKTNISSKYQGCNQLIADISFDKGVFRCTCGALTIKSKGSEETYPVKKCVHTVLISPGMRFGKLTVTGRTPTGLVAVKCDCRPDGPQLGARKDLLLSGFTTDCGCVLNSVLGQRIERTDGYFTPYKAIGTTRSPKIIMLCHSCRDVCIKSCAQVAARPLIACKNCLPRILGHVPSDAPFNLSQKTPRQLIEMRRMQKSLRIEEGSKELVYTGAIIGQLLIQEQVKPGLFRCFCNVCKKKEYLTAKKIFNSKMTRCSRCVEAGK